MINYIFRVISFQVLIDKTHSKNSNQFKYLTFIPAMVAMLFCTSCSKSNSNTDQVIEKQIQTQYRYYRGELKGFKGRNTTYLDDLFVGKWPEKIIEVQFDDLTKNEQKEFISYKQNGFFELGTEVKLLKMPNGRNAIGIRMPGMEFDKTDVNVSEISFLKMDSVPVFPDCEAQDFDCFFAKLDAHFTSNFNRKIVDDIFVSPGIQKVIVDFSIDENVAVTDVKVDASHIVIAEEAKRVIESLPQMKPGKNYDAQHEAKYTLPFKIIIN
ncbi:hypothetical protein [Polaribacter sp.]|uniref:hypothetical protein n=1 Tax=Polaribacter sp. TaxID=1920175 RepID=UPI003F6C52D9